MALRAKIRSDEAESEGCGGPTVEGDNEIWPDFLPQPAGTGLIFLISSSFVAKIHPVSVTPLFLELRKIAPVAAIPIVLTGPREPANQFICGECLLTEASEGFGNV